uniref:ATP synthase complex subunit 8 n=1 Tax=Abronia graminea TaxID=278977 RepID=H6VUH2_ABRGR|nr:ATPase8 [Abronia graminea]
MPQLNPGPWLMTFLITWFTYISIFLMKTQTAYFLNLPTLTTNKEQKTNPWTWPWP